MMRSEMIAGEVAEFLQQLFLAFYCGMAKCRILLPHIWVSSRNPHHPGFDRCHWQLHIAVWIKSEALFIDMVWNDVTLIGDTLKDHWRFGELGSMIRGTRLSVFTVYKTLTSYHDGGISIQVILFRYSGGFQSSMAANLFSLIILIFIFSNPFDGSLMH